MNKSSRLAAVFLTIFALPFCGAGLFVLLVGFQSSEVAGPLRGNPTPTLIQIVIGLVFSCVGFGLLAAVVFGPRKMRKLESVKAAHPDEPWMWREDWAQGRVHSKTKFNMISAWGFAALWNLVSAPVLVFVHPAQIQHEPKLLIALIFPLAGMGLLIRAIRETLRWFEFGDTTFEMTTLPCVMGRDLRGTIVTRFPHIPDHGIQLKLSCVNRFVTGSGKQQSTSEKILWRDERTISAAELCPGPSGVSIPVSFHVSLGNPQTDTTNPRNEILWLLEADASVPGVDYRETFELPVFKTKASPLNDDTQNLTEAAAVRNPPTNPTVLVRPSSDGGTEFYFPAARNKSFAAGTTIFGLLWAGASWGTVIMHAPFIFPLVFGLFDLLFIYIILQLWTGTSTIVVGVGSVKVRDGLFGAGRFSEIPWTEVSTIQLSIGAQSGGASGTPYYDIQLVRSNGLKVVLGHTVRDKQEAEWIVAEMKRLTGLSLPAKAMAAAAR